MAKSDGRSGGPTPQTRPPESELVDWDDDTVPGLDMDERNFDRVTAIPELPSELLAKKMMESAPSSMEPDPVSGLYECKVPGPPAAPSPSAHSPAPFELEQALFSAPAPGATDPLSRGGTRDASTAPPPRYGASTEPGPALEIDQSALDSAVAARGRWARPNASARDSDESPPASLELDLRGLEASLPPASDPELRALTDRYAMGDYTGALVVAEGILEGNPDQAEAARYAKNCRDVLMQMYSARLGSLDQVVSMAIPAEQIRWLSLDHRSGFLLSLVDGTSSIEEILDISGMPRLDALRIVFSLFSERVVALSPR
jgi:hypothetical protein